MRTIPFFAVKTVLAPIDFSAATDAVVYQAIALAQAVGGRVVLLHVIPAPPLVSTNFGMLDTSDPLAAEVTDHVVDLLRQWQRRLAGEGFTVHAVHALGLPPEMILEQADRLEADYIVVGSRGHSAIYRLLLGSTAAFVLRHAHVPVVIVPAAGPASTARKRGASALAPTRR